MLYRGDVTVSYITNTHNTHTHTHTHMHTHTHAHSHTHAHAHAHTYTHLPDMILELFSLYTGTRDFATDIPAQYQVKVEVDPREHFMRAALK